MTAGRLKTLKEKLDAQASSFSDYFVHIMAQGEKEKLSVCLRNCSKTLESVGFISKGAEEADSFLCR